MRTITIRNVPDEVHRALRAQAVHHGRSAEAEIRDILESATKPNGRLKLGSLLSDIGRRAKLTNEAFSVFAQVRDPAPSRPVDFG